jgi:peptidoglycan hydrolase-like protein with peptidoglycan-binding domain
MPLKGDPITCQPIPGLPETPVSLEKLIGTWERLRDLNEAGYSTVQSGYLIDVNYADGAKVTKSAGRGAVCSPFAVMSLVMALSEESQSPFTPKLADGRGVPRALLWGGNGFMSSQHGYQAATMRRWGLTNAHNGWPKIAVGLNIAYPVDATEVRRGDLVGICWDSGGGHAVFVWDVHLDPQGKVDAFQHVSSNGWLSKPEGGIGVGVDVGHSGSAKLFIEQTSTSPRRYKKKSPLFADDDKFVQFGQWCATDPAIENQNASKLRGMRVAGQGWVSGARFVTCARFHGVRPPEPYCMGGAPNEQQPNQVQNVQPQQVNQQVIGVNPGQVLANAGQSTQSSEAPTPGQLELEERLRFLYEVGAIDADPGVPDNVNDAKTQAAVKAFQAKSGLPASGLADEKTRSKVKEAYAAAVISPEGKRYIATGQGVRAGGGGGAGRDAGGGGGGAPKLVALYWRHGSARPGSQVAVHLVAENADGRSYPVKVRDRKSGETRATRAALSVSKGLAFAVVTVPASSSAAQGAGQGGGGGSAPAELLAVAEGLGETPAPLYVA